MPSLRPSLSLGIETCSCPCPCLCSVLWPSSPRALRSSKTLSGLRSRPSGAWYGFSGSGAGSGILSSVIDSVIVPFRVTGGSPGWQVAGLFRSALNSALNAVLHSVLVPSGPRKHFRVSGLGHQVPGTGIQVQVQVRVFGHLSSVIDSVIVPFRVAGGSPGWQVAGLFHSVLHSVLNAALYSALCSVLPLASPCLSPTANR
jgi:hypothetical protein